MFIDEIQKFRIINKLKEVYRAAPVNDRKESTAEHTWSAMMLADLILPLISPPLDKLRVFELLLYHDLVEIETGDVRLDPDHELADKKEKELAGMKILAEKLPEGLKKRYIELFTEYENLTSREAVFCKAIDALDAQIYFLDYKDYWKGWKTEFLRSKKQRYFEEFPELLEIWEEFLKFCEHEGYLERQGMED